MSQHDTQQPAHPVTQDLPLPGHYPCLTLQLNITRYQQMGVGRTVCVLREPGSNIEVGRWFLDTDDWDKVISFARYSFEQAIRNMRYLQLGDKDY